MRTEFHTIDGALIVEWDRFHAVFAAELDFPGYYGRNMNAWIDCMSDFSDKETLVALTISNVGVLRKQSQDIYDAIIECSAFVNWRLTSEGKEPVVALAFHS